MSSNVINIGKDTIDSSIISGNSNIVNNITINKMQPEKIERRDFLKVALIGGGIGSISTIIGFSSSSYIKDLVTQCISYFRHNDYRSLQTIDDIRAWAKQDKEIAIISNGKLDIYRGLIFPLFKLEEIEEMRFSSTSILWGHVTFKSNIISYEATDILAETFRNNKKKIDILCSTPDIKRLYETYGRTFTDIISDFDHVFTRNNSTSSIRYGKKFNARNYNILLRVANTNECYEISLLNSSPMPYYLQFNGKIRVYRLNVEQYKRRLESFEREFSESILYKDINEKYIESNANKGV